MIGFRVFILIGCCGILAVEAQEPSLEVIVPERDARVGEPYAVSYQVSWLGNARDFAVMPLEFESIEWGDAAVRNAVSELRGNTLSVTQSLEIIPREAGKFDWPVVTIGYPNPEAATPKENETPEANPSDPRVYPTLRAQSLPILVRSPQSGPWISSGLGAFLVFSIFVAYFVYTRRSRAIAIPESALTNEPTVEEVLHIARRHRLDGQYYEYFTALIRAAESAGKNSHSDLLKRLKSRAHEVGFGDAHPTEDELEGVFRDVQRAVSGRSDTEPHG
jgi:hypothetical protein